MIWDGADDFLNRVFVAGIFLCGAFLVHRFRFGFTRASFKVFGMTPSEETVKRFAGGSKSLLIYALLVSIAVLVIPSDWIA